MDAEKNNSSVNTAECFSIGSTSLNMTALITAQAVQYASQTNNPYSYLYGGVRVIVEFN